MECATHTRPAGCGMFFRLGMQEWLSAKHFRSFRFAEQ
jgi:hypothetical protein